jgi:iron complex transport system substrate-binding protein
VGTPFPENDPVASLSSLVEAEGDGFLIFRPDNKSLCELCGPLCLCGELAANRIHSLDPTCLHAAAKATRSTKSHEPVTSCHFVWLSGSSISSSKLAQSTKKLESYPTEVRRGSTEQAIGRRPLTGSRILIFVLLAMVTLALSCSTHNKEVTSPAAATREVTDESGRRVRLPERIDRIVSLAPNLTEIVYAVGAGDRLVGDTTYCDYPEPAKTVAKVGDTMHPSIERIIALKPQIVLVSTASQLEAFTKQLDEQGIAVYVTNPSSLDGVIASIDTLGALFGDRTRTSALETEMRSRIADIESRLKEVKPVSVFYQVSGEPLYTIGRESYLTDLVRRAGGNSVTADVPGAFPRYSDEAALAARPEAIILPTGGSMGAANSAVAAPLRNSPAALNNRVYKLNDDHLSRPGPRLINGLEEMARALHPESFK